MTSHGPDTLDALAPVRVATPRSDTAAAPDGSRPGTSTNRSRLSGDERGEGVISAAIAVLIMAFIGVGMWVAFNGTFQHAAKNIDHQVNTCIGQTSTSC